MKQNGQGDRLVEELSDLREFRALLSALEDHLREQRVAVGRLDSQALAKATAEEERAAERLALAIDRAATEPRPDPGDAESERLREEIRRAARRVVAQAQVNAVLVSDTAEAVADTLGVRNDAGTYDRHARRASRLGSITRKAA
jgi:hypothetical protein